MASRQILSKKPNILFMMSDDIGWFNISAYNLGIMGYRTPNIDRIAKEGALFTDFYGQQSCTQARRIRTVFSHSGRSTYVGFPGAKSELSDADRPYPAKEDGF
jgi:arylsulfatase